MAIICSNVGAMQKLITNTVKRNPGEAVERLLALEKEIIKRYEDNPNVVDDFHTAIIQLYPEKRRNKLNSKHSSILKPFFDPTVRLQADEILPDLTLADITALDLAMYEGVKLSESAEGEGENVNSDILGGRTKNPAIKISALSIEDFDKFFLSVIGKRISKKDFAAIRGLIDKENINNNADSFESWLKVLDGFRLEEGPK